MPFLNPEIRRPLLRRTLRQALLVMGGAVAVLSVSSFVVARGLLLDRATLHAGTLGQAAVDTVELQLRSFRQQAVALARGPQWPSASSGADLQSLRAGHPSLLAVHTASGGRTETTLLPVVDRDGWHAVTVAVPVAGETRSVTFAVEPLLERLAAAADASGRTADILFGRTVGGDVEVIRVTDPAERAAIVLGTLQDQRAADLALADALAGEERVGSGDDYRGVAVVAAGRFVPSLGWSVGAQIDAAEVLEGVRRLALFHAMIGGVCLLLAAALSAWVAWRWTAPVRSLTKRVMTLGPGSWAMTPTLDTQDEVAYLERVMADMASRLRAFTEDLEHLVRQRTEALRRQYELDRAVLTAVEYGVVTVDAAGTVSAANPAAERMLGKPLSSLLGAAADAALPLSLDGKTLLRDAHPLARALREGRPVHTDPGTAWTLAAEGQEPRSLSLVASPLRAGDTLFGAVAVFQDITRERQMEQLKSEFITLASHQLRTPLSIMQWQIEALQGSAAAGTEQVAEMTTAAKRMTSIVNALLQVARLEGGALTPVFAAADLAALVQESVAGLGKAAGAGIEIRVDLPPTLPCRTDAVLLNIVLQNLLENAVKYARDGGSVHVSATEQGGEVAVAVRDDGMGIPQEEQRHVFEKFFRGRNVRRQSTDGTGLGLYIAHMIVEQLGGTLTFASVENTGTTFTVTLPKEPKTTPPEAR